MDCYFNEGIKVFYRVAIAIIILFHQHTSKGTSEWSEESLRADIENAIPKFCKQIPVSPSKLLKTAFSIRRFGSQAITRIFIRIEMTVKSRSVVSGNKQLTRPHSSDHLPTSQSQMNIQMMSQTLTIREVSLRYWYWRVESLNLVESELWEWSTFLYFPHSLTSGILVQFVFSVLLWFWRILSLSLKRKKRKAKIW